MEIIIGLVLIAAAGVLLYTRSAKKEATEAGIIALGEPPATVVVPVSESTLVVEGAGVVEVPAKAPKAKKPAAKKSSGTPAIKATKPKAAAKPKAPRKPKAAK